MTANGVPAPAPPQFDLPVVPFPNPVPMEIVKSHIALAALPTAPMPAPINALLLLALEIFAAAFAL